MLQSYITYQDLLDTGLPLRVFAVACKLKNIRTWKTEGIPKKYENVIFRILKKNGFSAQLKQRSILTLATLPADSKTQKTPPSLANNIKTAVSLQPRGFQTITKIIENRPDLLVFICFA